MQKLELLLPPPVIALITAVLMWLCAHYLSSLTIDWLLKGGVGYALRLILGVACFVGSGIIGLASLRQFARARTTTNPKSPAQASVLVQNAFYAHSRNPMYLAVLLLLLCWGLYLANAAALLVVVGFVWFITQFQIKPEERFLEKKFGQKYLDYKKNVRRWL